MEPSNCILFNWRAFDRFSLIRDRLISTFARRLAHILDYHFCKLHLLKRSS